MKAILIVTLALFATTSNSVAQVASKINPKEVLDTPVDSRTLVELKNDVVKLSYGKQGRRIFVLKPDRSLDSLTEESSSQLLNDMPSDYSQKSELQQKRKRTNRKKSIREFAVTCNPLGEAVSLEIVNTSDDNAKTTNKSELTEKQLKLKSRKMQRLAELACLESQFEN